MTLDSGLAGRGEPPIVRIEDGFAAEYRVRFDEAGADGRIRTSAFLRFASDVAWRHSEAVGFDRTWYAERGRWWVVRAIELKVLAPVSTGETLRVATAVVGHRRIWARRRGEFRRPDGALAAIATTDWVILDERGRIIRIPADLGRVFPNPELDTEIVRVALPPTPPDAARGTVRVRLQDLDPMGHVNNAVYLDWIEEAVAAAGDPGATAALPRRVAIEYAAAAEPNDEVEVAAWRMGTTWGLRIARLADGTEIVRARLEPTTR